MLRTCPGPCTAGSVRWRACRQVSASTGRCLAVRQMQETPGISNPEARQPARAPPFSENWTAGDDDVEVIDSTTGKDELGGPSRLCKRAFYCRWTQLHSRLSSFLRVSAPPPSTYHQAKLAAEEYRSAQQALYRALADAGLGIWVKKPAEQDRFSLSSF
uniref:Adenosine deaminase RNA specific B1a n=1 Tax=Oryzias sinensis TaxID=183150 RepID=A0A8C8DPB8_9TELE